MLSLMMLALACSTPEPTQTAAAPAASSAIPAAAPAVDLSRYQGLFKPLPAEMADARHPTTQARVDLGHMLYFDARLSKNHDVSCNSCHQLDNYGVDGEPTSPGHRGQRGGRNSPTVYNAATHLAQFWDGRAADVEEQARGPVLNPVEMAMPDEATVVEVLRSIPGYAEPFAAAFPGEAQPVTYDNMAAAIGAFERKLVTPDRFDAFLAGDAEALTQAEREGLDTFMEVGCSTCHSGANLGGHLYQKMGLVKPYETADKGRGDLTGNAAEDFFFKVPSLRNIAETGPYFHDGQVETLEQAVALMAEHQLGRELTDAQVRSITTFLGALTGELPGDYIKAPTLPADGPDTPSPDPS